MEHIHSFFRTLSSGMASIGVITDPTTYSDIYFAVERCDDADEVSRLIDEVGFDLDTPDEEGNTILHHAISCDRRDVTIMLVQRAWETAPGVFKLPNHKGETPLLHAISMKRVALINVLLAVTPTVPFDRSIHGIEPGEHWRESLVANLILRANGDLNKALSLAVKDKCSTSVEYLISAGVSTVPLLADLTTDVKWCWLRGYIRVEDALHLLTDPKWMAAEHVEVRHRLMTPEAVSSVLRQSISLQGKQALVALRCFAEAGVSLSTLAEGLDAAIAGGWEKLRIVDGDTGETLLHWAAVSCVEDRAWDRLVDRYDPSLLNTPDSQGYTPLMLITARGDVPRMRDLVARGGRTAGALSFSDIRRGFHYEHQDAVSVKALILIEARGDISKALVIAMNLRQAAAAKLFADAGALVKAAEFQTPETMDWLIELGLVEAIDVIEAVTKLNCTVLPRDEDIVRSLTRPEVVKHVLNRLHGHPESEIFLALKMFADAGVEESLLTGTLSTLLESSTLEDNKFNNTVLHRAVGNLLGSGTESIVRLIAKLKPSLLNAQDADGKTPLMLAVEWASFEWVKSLVPAGARMGADTHIADAVEDSDELFGLSELCLSCAVMLIEAKGDMEKAFEIALEREAEDEMREFLLHGLSTVSMLQRADEHILGRMVKYGVLRADDVLEVLKQAMESGNETLVRLLAKPDVVMSSLPFMYERSKGKIEQVLREFMALGISGEDMRSCEAKRLFDVNRRYLTDVAYVKALDSLGFPAIPEILKLAPPSPVSTLGARRTQLLCKFVTGRGDLAETVKTLKNVDPQYVDLLSDTAFSYAYPNADSAIPEMLEKFRSLINAGLSPTYSGLAYLAPVIQREYINARTKGMNGLLAIQLWRRLKAMHMCAAVLKGENKYVGREKEQVRLRNVVQLALRDLLARDDLSNAQKVDEISHWMKSETASEHARSLLIEAQAKGYVATMKVLVSAGAPTKEAFLRQSERLLLGELGAQALTAKMIEWGGNVSAALEHLMASIEANKALGNDSEAAREEAALRKLLLVKASVGSLHQPDQAGVALAT